MIVDLNEPTLRKPYETFEGRITERMPQLIADGRVPASVSDIMERRLNSKNPNWKSLYFDTGDMIAYHPDGKFKVVRDAQLLRELSSQSELVNGALRLADGVYESLDGSEFKRKDAVFCKDLSAVDTKAHPVWQFVARDKALLDSYVNAMFPEMKRQFNYDEAMGVYLPSTVGAPQARALFVYWLEDRSQLSGRVNLGGDGSRLVGVAPEARGSPSRFI